MYDHANYIRESKTTPVSKDVNYLNTIELNIGTGGEDVELRRLSNSQVLHESCLLEAFNLKAAIEFQLKNCIK